MDAVATFSAHHRTKNNDCDCPLRGFFCIYVLFIGMFASAPVCIAEKIAFKQKAWHCDDCDAVRRRKNSSDPKMPPSPEWSEKNAVVNHVVVQNEFTLRKYSALAGSRMHVLGTVCATLDTATFRLNAVRDVCMCDWIQLPSICACISCSRRRRLQCLNEMANVRNTCDEPTIIMCALRREWKCGSVWVSVCVCLSLHVNIFIQHLYSIPAQAARTFAAQVSLQTQYRNGSP